MSRTILVADTEDWVRDRIHAVASRFGYDVTCSDNGIDALERFAAEAPYLVIVDAMLPRVSGLNICSKLRASAEGRSVPIVVTSSMPPQDAEQLEEMRNEHAFTAMLAKPFDDDAADAALIPFLTQEPDQRGRVNGLAPTLVSPGNAIGQIKERFLGEYLLELMRDLRTGILTARFSGVTKTVYLDRGEIVNAESNSLRDDLSRIMLIAGLMTAGEIEEVRAYQMAKFERDFATAVLAKEFLSEGGMRRARLARMSHIIVDLVPLTEVELSFRATAHLPPEIGRLDDLSAARLVFWSLRRLDGVGNFRARLPSTSSLLVRRPVRERFVSELHLTGLEEQILSLADGRRRLGDILSLVRVGADIGRVILCLLAQGLLDTIAAPNPDFRVASASSAPATATKGELGEALVANVFVRLGQRRATGRLRLTRDDEWRQVFLESGEIVWAMSSLDHHRLGTVLLDIGAVAEHDLSEALLEQTGTTGGRLAGILFEKGGLTLEELDRGRREQIQRIVVDSLTWSEGCWDFDPSATEFQERVTLTVPTPELVFESLMHLRPPTFVAELLAASDTVLMTDWDDQRINSDLSLSRSEKLILEVLEAGQTGNELTAFGFMKPDDLEHVLHAFLVLGVVRAVHGTTATVDQPAVSEQGPALDLVEEMDGDEPLFPENDEDSAVIRLGSIDRWSSKAEQLGRELEQLKAENERLSQRAERLEAALDRRASRPIGKRE